jgi:hypothetical protein
MILKCNTSKPDTPSGWRNITGLVILNFFAVSCLKSGNLSLLELAEVNIVRSNPNGQANEQKSFKIVNFQVAKPADKYIIYMKINRLLC